MTNQPPHPPPHSTGSTYGDNSPIYAQNIAGRDVNINLPDKPLTFPLHHLPPPNPEFVGRQGLLDALAQDVQEGQPSILTQTIAGLGGVGKSQIALAYAHAHRQTYDLIHWLTADPETTLLEGMRDLGRQLHLPVDASPDIGSAVTMVNGWLAQTERRWLLIVDNVDEMAPARLRQLLPGSGPGHILITSRNPNWQGVVDGKHIHPVDIFTPDEAEAYLEKALSARPEGLRPFGSKLAERLGYLPLALTHAAAYMRERGLTCKEYVRRFAEHQTALLVRHPSPNDYHATVMTTWQLSFDAVQETPGAADLLTLCSLLAPDDIPLRLLRRVGEVRETPLADELTFDDALAALRRYSLLEMGENGVRMHRLVQMVVREREATGGVGDWANSALALLKKAYRFDKYDMTTWPACAELLPHMRAAADLAAKEGVEIETSAWINNEIGYYLRQFIEMGLAWPYYERALEINEKVLGSEHPDTASSLNNMGYLLQGMGKNEEARPYYERALEIREKVLGREHPDTAQSQNNLGYLLQAMGKYEKAKPYYEQALAIREKILGKEHPDTARSLNNMGYILQAMRATKEARPYFEKALAIYETVLGTEHPDTARSLNNLGFVQLILGDYEKAQLYYEEALAIREKVLGVEHPSTAVSLHNMGFLFLTVGEYEKAGTYYERALAIREKVLGAKHPDTAGSLNNLGSLKRAMGAYEEARPYYERAMAIFEERLGSEHPNTITVRNNLAHIESHLP